MPWNSWFQCLQEMQTSRFDIDTWVFVEHYAENLHRVFYWIWLLVVGTYSQTLSLFSFSLSHVAEMTVNQREFDQAIRVLVDNSVRGRSSQNWPEAPSSRQDLTNLGGSGCWKLGLSGYSLIASVRLALSSSGRFCLWDCPWILSHFNCGNIFGTKTN